MLKSCTILFSKRGGINSQSLLVFFGFYFILFHTKESTVRLIIAASIYNLFHLTFNHDINCCQNNEIYKGEKADQDEDRGRVHCCSKENTMEVKTKSMRKEGVGCVLAVLGNKKFIVKF